MPLTRPLERTDVRERTKNGSSTGAAHASVSALLEVGLELEEVKKNLEAHMLSEQSGLSLSIKIAEVHRNWHHQLLCSLFLCSL